MAELILPNPPVLRRNVTHPIGFIMSNGIDVYMNQSSSLSDTPESITQRRIDLLNIPEIANAHNHYITRLNGVQETFQPEDDTVE